MTTTFQYTVRDRAGKLVKGTISAENQTMVMQRLKAGGYSPVSITQANSGMKKEITIPGFGKKVKLKDLSVMARQFATMVNSGLSLLRTLTILSEQTTNKELARVLSVVRNEVETGTALSAALGKHPRVFPPIMINMVRAGEVGGFLDSVMMQLAVDFESEVKLRGKVKSAMTYPVVVLCISVVAVIGMLLFIVPVFKKLFIQLGGKLPLPTQILVDLSGMLEFLLPAAIIGAIVFTVLWGKYKHTTQVRNVVDPLKLKMPVFGKLFQQIALSRFTRNLGTMMHSGVPILQSLNIVADTTGNIVVGRVVRDVQDSVRTGEALTAPLSKHPVIPSMVVQMMTVGEETGALDTMLHKISEFYDQEVEATTESLTALIEPLMIAFLGGVIGSMIVALYMPIFKIFTLIS